MHSTKRVCIHIGTDKAGSTAIQAFAFRNLELLASRGLHVVASRFDHHGPIYREMQSGGTTLLQAAAEAIRQSEAPRHLITFEGLYHLDGPMLAAFISAFAGLEVEVVLYLRRRSDKFRSAVAQSMKLNKAVRADWACERLLNGNFRSAGRGLNYLAIVRRWQEALRRADRPDALVLRVYEKSSFVGGDLLVDFYSRLGVLGARESPLRPPFADLPNPLNPSLSPAAQYLMVLTEVLGMSDPQRRSVKNQFVAADEPRARKHSLVPDEVALKFDTQYATQDRELAREFFGRDKLFTEPPAFAYAPPAANEFTDLLRRLYEQRARLPADHAGHDDAVE
jgi:hypothetical protein